MALNEPSFRGIERVMAQKKISMEEAADYIQRKNMEMAKEEWEHLKMKLDQKTNKKEE